MNCPPGFPLSARELKTIERDAIRRHNIARKRDKAWRALLLGIAIGITLGLGAATILIAAVEANR